ncbi:hypothetical protein GCM10010425_54740 [Streptomyces spororaveus]|uniref:Uncharacterized protein n=1 Tax=Streptomyces spororaveus TaxID=284039 RepID=A0ABQ3TA92_9ACTN|nr:hypothetical protein [Streptomyces spororaveus]GHI77328.1 hypothetical protein Sspor_28890 [Streptomyces spororaveus]
MNPTIVELALNNPVVPPSLAGLVMFGMTMLAKLYTFREVMRDTKPCDRAAIMEAHKNMWQVRRRR